MAKPDTAGPVIADPVVTDANQKKRQPMTAGQAIDWMAANRCVALETAKGERVRMLPGSPAVELFDPMTTEWKPVFMPLLIGMTFYEAEPEAPKLPDGCEWSSESVVVAEGVAVPKAKTELERNVYAALVEEFDARPKEKRDG